MLIARAPMRISFAGGGTDLPEYYEKHGGMVVSMAIDKYVYVFISPNSNGSLHISSSDHSTFFRHSGETELAADGRLRYARAFMREFGIRSGYSVFIASEMPPGTGLGSSSSLAVALTKALTALDDRVPDRDHVAERAADVEMHRLNMPIGKQDHYASAYGGLNAIYFGGDGIRVERLAVSERTRRWLQGSLLAFFTEQSRDSDSILAEQRDRSARHDPEVIDALHTIKGHAEEARRALLEDEPELLGDILHRTWAQKKHLAHGVSNPLIDQAYSAALECGALGGKIAGAGGGGFLMLVCPADKQPAVTRALEGLGLHRADFTSRPRARGYW